MVAAITQRPRCETPGKAGGCGSLLKTPVGGVSDADGGFNTHAESASETPPTTHMPHVFNRAKLLLGNLNDDGRNIIL
jgi:hypothetical protein